ncbi:YbaB/EbfC family nucleoid-associated protein [Lutibacter sp. HS1-25]|uniref:YbaB/EbfC family nucleoid-associated protein n=1 Tax=Lutibacter sp. HS1-25 TaxID=2485000 RepID=UPI0010121191|nr:YbaB/EbfC family nucleoid-associated protein [Lutibacter sp. HS1-25]RXP57652.1 YbaB/EbfC family nucleoid-associated protein [Lutibacter sp. HS1-25]
MFGDLAGMMGKLKEAQAKIEATKLRLNSIFIDGDAGNGMVKVTVTANSKVTNISIDDSLTDKEEIEDYLIIALNTALEKAKNINELELANAAKDGMPNIPGMDLFGK